MSNDRTDRRATPASNQTPDRSSNVIQEKSYAFAVRIVRMAQFLTRERKEFTLSRQVLRSGTSIGANVEEAIGGQSRKDFASKMSIAYKEARETSYWLRLLHETEYLDDALFASMHADCEELKRILYAIIETTRST